MNTNHENRIVNIKPRDCANALVNSYKGERSGDCGILLFRNNKSEFWCLSSLCLLLFPYTVIEVLCFASAFGFLAPYLNFLFSRILNCSVCASRSC